MAAPFFGMAITMIDTRKTMTERMALSAMKKFNTQNTPYSYKSSILLESIFKASRILGDTQMFNYVKDFMDFYVSEDGSVRTYELEEYSMDQVRMGGLFIRFYKLTGNEKYKKAVDSFFKQLQGQPRTPSGGFWHKKRYENQMWLDGLYMQGPFYAKYAKEFGDLAACLEDIVPQFELVYQKTYDPETGLLRHAWDESGKMPWANPENGQSPHVWSRALGWYAMALADLLETIPDNGMYAAYRYRLLALAEKCAPVILRYQDESGMWYQVTDLGEREGNYLESSGSAMFIYFFAKMYRLGYLDEKYLEAARKGFDGLCRISVTCDADGQLFLHDICKSAGLGRAADTNPYRDGSFAYYTAGEPRVTDNLHGIAPFISAAMELEYPGQLNIGRYTYQNDDNLEDILNRYAGKKMVVIPKGRYRMGPVRIPSHTHLVLEKGAVLEFVDDFESYEPVYTRWEGVDCWAMHPCFFIKDAEDIVIDGAGTLDGNGNRWWEHILKWKNSGRPEGPVIEVEKRFAAYNPDHAGQPGGGGGRPCQFLRPALLQMLDSSSIRIDGITLARSPFWTLHPICSRNLVFRNVTIDNPADSPNTDGIDIESCVNVRVEGCSIHVGDDGIAVKSGSGKDMMHYPRSENILVEDCTVKSAHGGFVIGSETASGVSNAVVRNCRFLGTDRGLRIKTRRDRGGIIENISVINVYMENTICPISLNKYYHCGNDDPGMYSLSEKPVTETTPVIRNIVVDNVRAVNCRSGAAFIAGLPEMHIQNVEIRNSVFEVSDKVEKALEMEMCSGIPESDYRGIRVLNADVRLTDVKVNVNPPVLVENY